MLLSDIETMTRQDLFDTTATRWSNSDIDRAIDKAVDRYSQYYPNIVFTDMSTQPYQRTYPYPTSWNSAYPVLWIEKVLYPLQIYGTRYAAPTTAPSVTATTGSGLNSGSYQYLVTFLTQGGETTAGPIVSVTTGGSNLAVALSNIPLAPSLPTQPPTQAGMVTNTVIGRAIYRTLANGSTFYYLASIADNTTTTFTDTASDSSLSGLPQPPSVNSSGVMVWPPCSCDFSEYSNMYDSSSALASGGNMGLAGAVGDGHGPTGTQTPSFTVLLSNTGLPQDNTLLMRVFYATKQQLDASGSTIPEVHHDVIVLGASAYALAAYQIPTNDNFDFQDGGLRDRIDDTHIPSAWLQVAQDRLQQFEARLLEIKQQRDFASSARVHWGDIPAHWPWL